MRLGAQSSDVKPGTLAHQIYGDVVTERHRHRYEANVNYLDRLRKAGLVISALTQREHLTEIVELPQACTPGSSACSSTPSSSPRPGTATRCSTPSSRPRWTTRPREGCVMARPLHPLKRRGRMKLCGFDVGLDQPFFLIAGPCVIESEQLQMDVAGTLKEITTRAGHSLHLQEQLRQGQPLQRHQLPRRGHGRGLEILAKVKRELGVPVLTDVHDEARSPRWRRGGCAADAGLPVPPDRFHPRRGPSGKPVNIKKGQFLAPARHEERHRQGPRRRARWA
jgi:hypothetical protein